MTKQPQWRKSTFSGSQQGDCVEVADLGTEVGMRDSKDREGGMLSLTREQMAGLIAGVRAGEFDDLA